MTDAGEDFYRHAVAVLREAELAENTVRHRLSEPSGTIRCTGGVATMQFAMTGIISDFLIQDPKVNIVVHAIDRPVDIVGENFDIAIRAHSGPLPDSNLVKRTLAPAPWFLFAGSDYLAANGEPEKPQDLRDHPSLFMMRPGVDPVWRLRPARQANQARNEVVMPLTPRLLSDDEIGLQEAAIRGLGIRGVARLHLPHCGQIRSPAAGIAELDRRRLHDYGAHSVQAGTAAVGSGLP